MTVVAPNRTANCRSSSISFNKQTLKKNRILNYTIIIGFFQGKNSFIDTDNTQYTKKEQAEINIIPG
jgi:hypothetical protein